MIPLVFAHVEQHALAKHARRADDTVDRTPVVDGGGNDLLANIELGDVAGDGDSAAAFGRDLGDDGVGDLARRITAVHRHAIVGDDDVGTPVGTGKGNRLTDAGPTAGDCDVLAFEMCGHVELLNVGRRDANRGFLLRPNPSTSGGDHKPMITPGRELRQAFSQHG